MTDYFVREDGDDGKDGLSYENGKATITAVVAVAPLPVEGDRIFVAPGVYRELVTVASSGDDVRSGTEYGNDTVTVTEGSTTVTAVSGSNWSPAVLPGDRLFVPWLAHATDGTGTGAAGYSSATETFEALIDEFCINIDGQGSYRIATFVGANNITVGDINGVGFPAAPAPTHEFWVPSNEGSYEIASVESDTSLTLVRPWSGPTYSGRDYVIIRPISLIGDETGAHTDGIGGTVRITGSDDDQTIARARCIDIDGYDYWLVKGFQLDTVSSVPLRIDDAEHVTVEDCCILNAASRGIVVLSDSDYITIRRCAIFGGDAANGIELDGNGIKWAAAIHIENVHFDTYNCIEYTDFNNVTVKSCTSGMAAYRFGQALGALDAGACMFVHDCEIHYCADDGLEAAVAGQIVANWNNYWGNNNDRTNVGVVGATNTTEIYIPTTPLLLDKYRYPVRFFPPSEWWDNAQYAGLYPANEDIYGVPRPTTNTKRSLGPYQDFYATHDTATVYGGEAASLEHVDARRTQFRVPTSSLALTITVWVYAEAGYAGTAPQLIVWQPEQTAVEDTASGTTAAWEQLSVSFTPAAAPPYIWVELASDNTAAAVGVYWNQVSVTPS